MALRRDVRSYAALGQRFSTQESSPEQLIYLLFEKACCSLQAVTLLQPEEEGTISTQDRMDRICKYHEEGAKTLQILVALEGLLDLENGGAVALQLKETYGILKRSLWAALKEKNLRDLKKILEALQELKSGWNSLVSSRSSEQDLTGSAG